MKGAVPSAVFAVIVNAGNVEGIELVSGSATFDHASFFRLIARLIVYYMEGHVPIDSTG
jgi:hypothetical protein